MLTVPPIGSTPFKLRGKHSTAVSRVRAMRTAVNQHFHIDFVSLTAASGAILDPCSLNVM